MERQSQVLEVQVEHEGSVHRVSYFVENGTIHANIGGRLLAIPTGPRSASDTVKSLMFGYLSQRSRKPRHAAHGHHALEFDGRGLSSLSDERRRAVGSARPRDMSHGADLISV
jgi:hypothetical protein